MRVGSISGCGTCTLPVLPRLTDPAPRICETEYGSVEVTAGTIDGVEMVHVCRHGAGPARLSSQVTHKANLAALLRGHWIFYRPFGEGVRAPLIAAARRLDVPAATGVVAISQTTGPGSVYRLGVPS